MNLWKCCGNELSTPFCPLCGNGTPDDLKSLMLHVEKQIANHQRALGRFEDWANGKEGARYTKRLTQFKNRIKKWTVWRDGLQELRKQHIDKRGLCLDLYWMMTDQQKQMLRSVVDANPWLEEKPDAT